MLELDHLTVSGDVTLGKNVSVKVTAQIPSLGINNNKNIVKVCFLIIKGSLMFVCLFVY